MPSLPCSHQRPAHLACRFACVWSLLMVFCLVGLSLAACTNDSSQKSTGTSTRTVVTVTPISTPELAYQADWSQGLKAWRASSNWHAVSASDIQIETNESTALTVPFTPDGPDYTLEVRVQIVKVLRNGGSVELVAARQSGKDGYKAGITHLLVPGTYHNGLHPQVQSLIDPQGSMERGSVEIADYEPFNKWHTLRVTVRDSRVSFSIDNTYVSGTSSTKTQQLSAGPLQLVCNGVVLRVNTLKVFTL